MAENSDPQTPAELRAAATHINPVVRRHVAQHRNTPEDVLLELLEDEDSWIDWNLAQNAAAPDTVLLQVIARGKFVNLVGANRSASAVVLTSVANSGNLKAMAEVARNPSAPPAILHQLATSSDFCIRWGLARNTAAPVEILQKLAEDPHEKIRRCVARNRNTPKPLKAALKNALGM